MVNKWSTSCLAETIRGEIKDFVSPNKVGPLCKPKVRVNVIMERRRAPDGEASIGSSQIRLLYSATIEI